MAVVTILLLAFEEGGNPVVDCCVSWCWLWVQLLVCVVAIVEEDGSIW